MATGSFVGERGTLIAVDRLFLECLAVVFSIVTRELLRLIEGRIVIEITLSNLFDIVGVFRLIPLPILAGLLIPVTGIQQLLFATHHIFNQFLPLQRILSKLISALLNAVQNRADIVLDLIKVGLVIATFVV